MNEVGKGEVSAPLLLSNSSRRNNRAGSFNRIMNAPIGRSSPSPSTSSSISENYSQDEPPGSSSSTRENRESFRAYTHFEGGPHIRRGSISPAGSVASIHDTHFLNDRVRCLESEKLAIMIDHNNLIREFNKRMESHLEEIRNLKEVNHHMDQESTELRDLCCLLDDDRQKCRKLAKEWQRFGRYTVTIMRNEVLSYQEKLRSLETRQCELIKENSELRDLCVYLDSQRTGNLDDSNSEKPSSALNYTVCKQCNSLNKGEDGLPKHEAGFPSEDINSLRMQVLQLEKEKDHLQHLLLFGNGKSRKKRVSFSVPEDDNDSSSTASEIDRLDFPPSFGSVESFSKSSDANLGVGILRSTLQPYKNIHSDISPRNSDVSRIRNESLSEENILEIKEKLSKSKHGEATLTEREISVLKDMCNVVTEKVRTDSNASLNASSDVVSPISPPPSALGFYPHRESNEQLSQRSGTENIIQRRGSSENIRQYKGSNDNNSTHRESLDNVFAYKDNDNMHHHRDTDENTFYHDNGVVNRYEPNHRGSKDNVYKNRGLSQINEQVDQTREENSDRPQLPTYDDSLLSDRPPLPKYDSSISNRSEPSAYDDSAVDDKPQLPTYDDSLLSDRPQLPEYNSSISNRSELSAYVDSAVDDRPQLPGYDNTLKIQVSESHNETVKSVEEQNTEENEVCLSPRVADRRKIFEN